MLAFKIWGTRGPLVVALHWLGGSAETWADVGAAMAERGATFVAVDLPGFGHAAEYVDTSIEASVGEVVATVRALRAEHAGHWALMGHSMGGKMAAIVARAEAGGEAGLDGLRGMVLVSPSPPGVEPMSEHTRRKMMESLGESTRDAEEDRRRAQQFVEDNVGELALKEGVLTRATDDVLRMSRAAFRAWLQEGSKEDWSERVRVLDVPALMLAGSEEAALGPDAQAKLTAPHFAKAEVMTLEGGGHLGVLERPHEVVERAVAFLARCGLVFETVQSELDEGFRSLLASERTSPQTRAVLMQRMEVEGSAGDVFTASEAMTMRAMLRRVLPGCGFDLTARIAEWMGEAKHDGWRHDELPADADAWRKGLRSIDTSALREYGVPFVAVDDVRQDALLTKARERELGGGVLGALGVGDVFSAAEMTMWFGEFCAEVTKMYVSDPRAMQRMGFTGFADEGGFTQIRLGEMESFEPEKTAR